MQRIGSALVLALSIVAFPSLAATQTAPPSPSAPLVDLSKGAGGAAALIAARPKGEPLYVQVDATELGPSETQQILYALADRRSEGGVSIAFATDARAGGAIIALACDAIVVVGSDSLTGAGPAWCPSRAQRDAIAADLARLGRIAPELARRFVDATEALSWTPGQGFSSSVSGQLMLAPPSGAIRIDRSLLSSVGVETHASPNPLDAALLVASGQVKPRADLIAASAPTAPTTPSAPAAPGAGNSKGVGGPPSLPANQPDVASSEIAKKMAPKLAEYAATLAELKTELQKFNEYYTGDEGIWTSANKSLKEVWIDGSDHTRDANTKLACERMQRDLKSLLRKIENSGNTVERIAGSVAHPEVARIKSNQPVLDGLRAAFERNKASNYDQYYPQVLKLK